MSVLLTTNERDAITIILAYARFWTPPGERSGYCVLSPGVVRWSFPPQPGDELIEVPA